MTEQDIRRVLGQVKLFYEKAEEMFNEGQYDGADEQISVLRDLLDDIYDRPEEEVTKAEGQEGQ